MISYPPERERVRKVQFPLRSLLLSPTTWFLYVVCICIHTQLVSILYIHTLAAVMLHLPLRPLVYRYFDVYGSKYLVFWNGLAGSWLLLHGGRSNRQIVFVPTHVSTYIYMYVYAATKTKYFLKKTCTLYRSI